MILNSDQVPTVSSAFTGSGSDSQSPVPGSGNSGGGESLHQSVVRTDIVLSGYPGDSGTFCHSPDTSGPGTTPFTDRSVI